MIRMSLTQLGGWRSGSAGYVALLARPFPDSNAQSRTVYETVPGYPRDSPARLTPATATEARWSQKIGGEQYQSDYAYNAFLTTGSNLR